MLSTLVEALGLIAFVLGTYIEAGRAPALFVGGCCLLVVGLALDGVKVPTIRLLARRAAKKPKG